MGRVLQPGIAEDKAGRQRIDRDAVLPELARQRAGESKYGALGCDIGQHARHALVGGARGDVDDLAATALDHVRHDMADHQIRAPHVDRHHAIPQFRVPLVEISRLQRRVERGVVHQDVDLTKAFDGLRDQVFDRLFVADVELDAGNRIGAMAAGDFRGELLAVGDVGDHHARALGGERLRIMPADALGAAGDDCGFSFQPRHALSSGEMTANAISAMKRKTERTPYAERYRRPFGHP